MDERTSPTTAEWPLPLTPARQPRRRPDPPARADRRPAMDAEATLAAVTHALTQLERTVDRLILRIARLEERLLDSPSPVAEPAPLPLRRTRKRPPGTAATHGDDAHGDDA